MNDYTESPSHAGRPSSGCIHRPNWQALVLAIVLVLVGLISSATSPAAAQTEPPMVAFVDSEDPSADVHHPRSFFSPNGRRVVVFRNWEGAYTARFPGLNFGRGSVQVEAIDSTARCGVTRWFGELIGVQCFDQRGRNVDTRFTAVYTDDQTVAWVWASDDQNPELYDANVRYSNNPGLGGPVSVDRNYAGRYTVRFPGQDLTNSNFQVSAYQSNAHCRVSNLSGPFLGVECFGPNGQEVDSKFTAIQQPAEPRSINLTLSAWPINCGGGLKFDWTIRNGSSGDARVGVRLSIVDENNRDQVVWEETLAGTVKIEAKGRKSVGTGCRSTIGLWPSSYEARIELVPHNTPVIPIGARTDFTIS